MCLALLVSPVLTTSIARLHTTVLGRGWRPLVDGFCGFRREDNLMLPVSIGTALLAVSNHVFGSILGWFVEFSEILGAMGILL